MEDVIENYNKKKEKRFRNLLSKIGIGHVILIAILFFIAISITNKPDIDPRYNYIIYATLIGIIILMYYKSGSEKEELIDWFTAASIVEEASKKMLRQGIEFSFDSKVKVMAPSHNKYENDLVSGYSGPVMWNIGVREYIHGSTYYKDWVCSVHPYKGLIMGWKKFPMGFSGREEMVDVKIVPVNVVEGSSKDFKKG